MWSPKFDRVKQENPALAPLLDQLIAYVAAQREAGQPFIIPKLAAAALHLNDGEAFVLLEVLAQAGVLRRAFNVYCRESGMLLATVDELDQLDNLPHCDYCDCEHKSDEVKLEIAFRPTEESDGFRRAA